MTVFQRDLSSNFRTNSIHKYKLSWLDYELKLNNVRISYLKTMTEIDIHLRHAVNKIILRFIYSNKSNIKFDKIG